MLHEMGIETGIDLERCSAAPGASRRSAGLSGHLLTAGPVDWH